MNKGIIIKCTEQQKKIFEYLLDDIHPCFFNYELCDDDSMKCSECIKQNILYMIK